MNLMTIMYIAIQTTLNDTEDMSMAYGKLRMLMNRDTESHLY
jgi:hypothetical protein